MWHLPGLIRARRFLLAAIVISLLSAGSRPSFAQEESNPSALFRSSVRAPLPNVTLPRHIPAPQGQLTLFADYAAADAQGVPLFLVNRTGTPVSLPSQDGDIYVKLEGQEKGGGWERAQSHTPSDCGNSYVPVTLPPGQFFEWRGYTASHGQKGRVRYSCYGGARLISNEGDGLIAAEDLKKARYDTLALRAIPEAIVNRLSREASRSVTTSLPGQVAALRLLQCYADSPKLKTDAQALASQLTSVAKAGSEEARAAAAIEGILKGPWPAQPSPDALFARCAQALSAKGNVSGAEFSAPETERALVWEVLATIAAHEFFGDRFGAVGGEPPDPARWRPIIASLAEALERGSREERTAIAGILTVGRLADETLPDQFFERALFLPEDAIQRACAAALSRRMRWHRLAEMGWALEPRGQLIVFLALACPPSGNPPDPFSPYNRTKRDPGYSGEDKFWKHVMTTQTIEAAYGLRYSGAGDQSSFDRTVHDPLRDFLLNEAARSEAAAADFDLGSRGYMMTGAVDFLAAWGLKEDHEVFTRLLNYRGYLRQEGARGEPLRPYVIQRYAVREAARRALLKQGVPVPQSLEIELDVTGTAAAQPAALR